MSQSSKPVPIALPHPLLEKIDLASTRLGISKQEVMRMAMAIGLEHFSRIDYNIAGAVLDTPSARLEDQVDGLTEQVTKLNHNTRVLADRLTPKPSASPVNREATTPVKDAASQQRIIPMPGTPTAKVAEEGESYQTKQSS